MKILIACECSGVVRDAFAARGWDAWSCDIVPGKPPKWQRVVFSADCDEDGNCPNCGIDFGDCGCYGPTQDGLEYHESGGVMYARMPMQHLCGDVRQWLNEREQWNLMIAHPDCTYLVSSGLHWNHRRAGRDAQTDQAVEFVRLLLAAPILYIAIENPIGCLSSRIRKPDQIIQPWQFGDDASKATCLWLKNLPALEPTDVLPGGSRARRANQTKSGQNKLAPSPTRQRKRSITYPGIAAAMADQWTMAVCAGVAA